MTVIKAWALPLFRTFLAVFLTTLLAGLVNINFAHFHATDLNAVAALVLGAIGTAVNALIIGAQKVVPGVPDPVPPVAAGPKLPVGDLVTPAA